MRSNRKKTKEAAFAFPCAAILLVGIFLAAGYVWLNTRCREVGDAIQKLEAEKLVLDEKSRNEMCRWMKMRSPVTIERELKRRGIAMRAPRTAQLVRLSRSEELDVALASASRPVKKGSGRRAYRAQ